MGNKKENSLFLRSGCLTPVAIRLYNDGKLTGEDLVNVNRHLEECSLCKEAVEGFKSIPGRKEQKDYVQDIKRGLSGLLNLRSDLSTGDKRIRRVYSYVAAAASVIVLIGVFSIYHFLLKQDNDMIADNIEVEQEAPEEISEEKIQPPEEKDIITSAEKKEQGRAKSGTPVDREKEIEVRKNELAAADKKKEIKKPEPAVPQQKGLMIDSGVRPDMELKPVFKVEGYEDFDDYINKNVKYPEAGLEQGVSDSVKVGFFINKKGKVENVSIVEGSYDVLNNEAIRIVSSSPPWIPAEKNGERVRYKMSVTVKFH